MQNLRKAIQEYGYLQFYLAFGDGNLRQKEWHEAATVAQGSLRTLINVFLLNETEDVSTLSSLIGIEAVERICNNEILERNGNQIQSKNYVLISFRGFLIFHQIGVAPQSYFGADSIALATYQTPSINGRTLDLCSGPGIQAMVASLHSRESHSVEINEKVHKVAKVNIELNSLENKIILHHCSNEEFLKTDYQNFDLITFNPPLLPIPDELEYPFVGNGGNDGLKITKNILTTYSKKLNNNGRFEFVGTGLGYEGQPLFVSELSSLMKLNKIQSRFFLLARRKLISGSLLFDCLVQTTALFLNKPVIELERIFLDHFANLKRNELYFFFASCSKKENFEETQIIDFSNHYMGDWFL
ncbi:MAG: methyltransferase [Verrucomicrobiae bacterium]|nr:methyltransferase [Verrucomicrobiae bacterium]